jgi:hypothetical protein
VWDPIDDPARLILHFKSAAQAEEMRKTLAGLAVLAQAARDDPAMFPAAERDDG